MRTGIRAGLVAGALSGVPSTVHALLTRRDALAATRAAGALLLPEEERTSRLLAAAVPVHLAVSLGWAVLLSAVLPRRSTVLWGALASLVIAAIDLHLPGRRAARVRALAVGPQIADHLAFGVIAGAVIRSGRDRRQPDWPRISRRTARSVRSSCPTRPRVRRSHAVPG